MAKKKKKLPEESPPELQHCRYCGGIVAPDAPACVHCGTPSPLKKPEEKQFTPEEQHALIANCLWILFGFLFLVTLLGVLIFPSCRG